MTERKNATSQRDLEKIRVKREGKVNGVPNNVKNEVRTPRSEDARVRGGERRE